MIKTPLSTVIGGAFWTPGATVINGKKIFNDFIKSLFADGSQGIYLNPQDAVSVSDLSSIKDLSGNNNHALQANSTSRASLITDPSGYKSLKFDGIDDSYATQSINFTATDKVTVIAAVRKLSDAALAIVVETGTNYSIPSGGFALFAPFNAFPSFGFGVSGGVVLYNQGYTGYEAPRSLVTSLCLDLSATDRPTQVKFNIDGAGRVIAGGSAATGKFANTPIFIGRRGGTSLPFNGQIYALLVIGKLLDDATTQRIEKEFAKYIGVTL